MKDDRQDEETVEVLCLMVGYIQLMVKNNYHKSSVFFSLQRNECLSVSL